jgi:hypothetical protein
MENAMLVVGLAAAVLASVFSGPMFIKPRFKSTAVFVSSQYMAYSDESETEQIVQLLQFHADQGLHHHPFRPGMH